MNVRTAIEALRRSGSPDPGIASDKQVVFFPTDADLVEGQWHIPVHGWIYRPTELSRLRRAGLWLVKRALRRHVPADEKSKTLFRERVGAFLADNERWERVQIRLGEATFKLKRSHANGHFTGSAQLAEPDVTALVRCGLASKRQDATWASFRALTRGDDRRTFDGAARLLPPEGLSVISDIDDTIKVTQVASRRNTLRNTFVREFAGVPGMAALYRHWHETLGAAFHYVSASPWHLYPFLEEFLAGQGFPQGTFYLRLFRLMPGDLPRLLRSGRRVKLTHARNLLRRFPRRRFILVGDSGESDPALYARLYREFPEQVEKILIRDFEDSNSRRSLLALGSLPTSRYRLFKHVGEIDDWESPGC